MRRLHGRAGFKLHITHCLVKCKGVRHAAVVLPCVVPRPSRAARHVVSAAGRYLTSEACNCVTVLYCLHVYRLYRSMHVLQLYAQVSQARGLGPRQHRGVTAPQPAGHWKRGHPRSLRRGAAHARVGGGCGDGWARGAHPALAVF